ncbi:hypothetical protein GPROT2_01476 [Gammaproteobacteria bacterium]|nr:DUF2065 domain-containing protein [Gammaproteobacteria bacterium]QOJ31785.1 MAG: DUF2065 domain-containing protein [Gammaproteobacteria bacterium]CAG0941868.1 hypothetical protein GPROT2_01476 [Gammaproteobacteria bacterium]
MQWADLFAALALYLVIEGLLPFASPSGWRRSLEMLSRLSDAQLRVFGLTVVVSGLTLLVLVRGFA